MAGLCGKGIWLAYSYNLQRAAEMATSIGANYLLVKVGHGPYYFPETTREMAKRVRTLGFRPLAWVQLNNYAPQDALKAIVESQSMGYEATVLALGMSGAANVTGEQLQPLVDGLDNVEIPTQRLYLASPPLPYLADRRVLEVLAPVCQAGWMPLSFAAWDDNPRQIVDRDIYQTLGDLSLVWQKTPEVYPVLSPRSGDGETALLPEDFIPWVEGITRHGVDFFSVFHAADTEKALWPMLESVNLPCLETAEHISISEKDVVGNVTIPQPVYITVTASDTVWGIIARHGLSKQQFWDWNAHLWESRALPRDPDYLQEGWRIRVK
jgi:hypothetical protein